MTISEAIAKAKKENEWFEGLAVAYGTSVDVGFINREGREDETQFDLYAFGTYGYEKELNDLWEDQHNDILDADVDAVTYVSMLGYIAE